MNEKRHTRTRLIVWLVTVWTFLHYANQRLVVRVENKHITKNLTRRLPFETRNTLSQLYSTIDFKFDTTTPDHLIVLVPLTLHTYSPGTYYSWFTHRKSWQVILRDTTTFHRFRHYELYYCLSVYTDDS